MRLVCMLTACILLMNTAGYAVAADDTAFESEVGCEKSPDQCSSLNESYSEDMVDSDGTLPSGADQLSADNTEPPVSVDREVDTPNNTTDKPEVADADMANVSGNSGSHFQAAGDNSGVNHANTLSAAVDLKKYIETYGKLPSTVSVGSQKLTIAQFLDLMLKDLLKTAGKSASLTVRSVKAAPNPSGSAAGQLSRSAYIKLAENVLKFINSNGRAPNYASSSIGRISFDNLIYAVSRILAFHADNGRLPNYVTVKKISAAPASPPSSLKNRRENDPYSGESTSRYLSATANCQVNDTAIRSLAASLTSGLTSAWDKATAIFNWVRDSISYSFYYNTRYGATGTLKTRTGNCVDHSHLLVALFRAAGLAARYVHGTCTFTSGNTYGHVWAQVLVGDTWYAADATSSRNSLGAVSSWNTATAKIKGTYASLPF
ncbi:pseudomurein-binding repeat-containing protein [Methanothermobacter sp.]|uniref:pseudomurein-binding repeat-containing protein n=1 Tax=Methanothermobacter sp. TaxID=1884223 RepID=UPI00260989FA|nr:pseudomurein-binding repeat-containing protein [Methanothermobacter sp.]MDI9615489.1 pseudomurein-binding repeat-containing protein [Methanothermobacter sp.]